MLKDGTLVHVIGAQVDLFVDAGDGFCRVPAWFDGQILAAYLVATGSFEHPISRRELAPDECRRLDIYLKEHKLNQARVLVRQSTCFAARIKIRAHISTLAIFHADCLHSSK